MNYTKANFKAMLLITLLIISSAFQINGQTLAETAESIRKEYKIPELGYAVVSSDTVLEIQTLGFKRINSKIAAEATCRSVASFTLPSFLASLWRSIERI